MIPNDASAVLNYSFSLSDNFYKVAYFVRDNKYLINSFDISIGKRFQSEWFEASVFGGPSYIFGEKPISFGDKEKYMTFGLQTDLQLLFRIANEVGIGLGLYNNLNFVKNYSGININITLGNGL